MGRGRSPLGEARSLAHPSVITVREDAFDPATRWGRPGRRPVVDVNGGRAGRIPASDGAVGIAEALVELETMLGCCGSRCGAPRWIIVAAEPITDVDTTAADMLHNLDVALNDDGVHLVFAELKDPVRHKIDRYELTRTIDSSHFFPTLEAAIAAFQAELGAERRPADRNTERDGPVRLTLPDALSVGW